MDDFFYPQLIPQVWHFLNSCLMYWCASSQPSSSFFEVFGVIFLKPPAVTPHHTLILGHSVRTLSSLVNFGGECCERSDPDSVLCSYISRQIKPGLPRGQQDEDEEPTCTYSPSQCGPKLHCHGNASSWAGLL